jgi:nucleolar protein 6
VEFEGYDHMKTCLKVFHHSMFNDGLSPARKINVELTYVCQISLPI